jgi:hypothetical protein
MCQGSLPMRAAVGEPNFEVSVNGCGGVGIPELKQPLTAVTNYLEAGRQLLATGAGGPERSWRHKIRRQRARRDIASLAQSAARLDRRVASLSMKTVPRSVVTDDGVAALLEASRRRLCLPSSVK